MLAWQDILERQPTGQQIAPADLLPVARDRNGELRVLATSTEGTMAILDADPALNPESFSVVAPSLGALLLDYIANNGRLGTGEGDLFSVRTSLVSWTGGFPSMEPPVVWGQAVAQPA
jgi:hypothetical protein